MAAPSRHIFREPECMHLGHQSGRVPPLFLVELFFLTSGEIWLMRILPQGFKGVVQPYVR